MKISNHPSAEVELPAWSYAGNHLHPEFLKMEAALQQVLGGIEMFSNDPETIGVLMTLIQSIDLKIRRYNYRIPYRDNPARDFMPER